MNKGKEFPIKLNLSDREKNRIANQYRDVAKAAIDLADTVQNRDDLEIIMQSAFFNISLSSILELNTIIKEAIEKVGHLKNNTQSESEDFPEFINKL